MRIPQYVIIPYTKRAAKRAGISDMKRNERKNEKIPNPSIRITKEVVLRTKYKFKHSKTGKQYQTTKKATRTKRTSPSNTYTEYLYTHAHTLACRNTNHIDTQTNKQTNERTSERENERKREREKKHQHTK